MTRSTASRPAAARAALSAASRPPRASERGFTLIELMVVIVILAGLITLVGPKVFNALAKGNISQAENQMFNFAQAIDLYYMEHRKLPASLESLTEEDQKTGSKWMETIPKDPWGQPYDYQVINSKKYKIRSYGDDQQEGTSDDIIWPKEDQGD